ncbi:MAG: hypothetical protein DRH93_21265, partial [Deltaproteobacteria bacterium]
MIKLKPAVKFILGILILTVPVISPLYADYLEMNEALEKYIPPEYVNDSLKFKTEGNKLDMAADK